MWHVFPLGRRLGHGRLERIRWLHLTQTRHDWPERFFKRHGDKTVFSHASSCEAQRAERYFGSLLPLALNFSPSGVSAPPPAGLVWQSPQAFPVSLANCAVAAAGRETSKEAAPASANMAAVLHAMTSAIFAFTFIVGLSNCDEGVMVDSRRKSGTLGLYAVARRVRRETLDQDCDDQ
jgi:hypothetical protein